MNPTFDEQRKEAVEKFKNSPLTAYTLHKLIFRFRVVYFVSVYAVRQLQVARLGYT